VNIQHWLARLVLDHSLRAVLLVALLVGGVRLAYGLWRLQKSIARYRDYWSVPRGMTGGLRYVALGDSAAQGIGASQPMRGYVGVIANRLQQATGQPVEIINLSKSGARIADVVREQLPRLAGLHADLITVGVGGNDIGLGGWDRAAFSDCAKALCAALPAGNAVVADVPWFMHGRWAGFSQAAAQILAQECSARDIAVAPLYEAIHARGWWGMFTMYAADWFHPNDHGHCIWADAFWQPIARSQLPRLHASRARARQ
jgi:lysophospholipase L1-like esterase